MTWVSGQQEQSRLSRTLLILTLVCTAVVLYWIPSYIEGLMMKCAAPPPVVLLFGDLAGCTVIAMVVSCRFGIGMYLGLSFLEYWLFRSEVMSLGALIWVTDLGPTVMVAALAVYAGYFGRNWRRANGNRC